MDKAPESKVHFTPVIEVNDQTFRVEMVEHRDYFVLSARVDEQKVISVPGFDIEMMLQQLEHNIRYYFDQKK
ncbi:hypothetical protein [Jeotgalibacillus soli]|uniref:Uncharacterized protein n=1 Tax=Jeotgalibacillus soli TaxID=889306 RepID=A0A0C2R3Z9_9BACL|nr:hypothetical protein [Jeotgalibacillus soli]KIL44980.1 hypothetical protein KP78_25240 [Jeotgalibacillus soli]